MFITELAHAIWRLLVRPSSRTRQLQRQMGSATRRTGDAAEEFALRYLEGLGFRPLARNLEDSGGELDIVMRAPGFEGVVVVEVRARAVGGLKSGLEAVDTRKRRKVVKAARRLLRRNGFVGAVRFDIVGVALTADGTPISAEHVPNAFDGAILSKGGGMAR